MNFEDALDFVGDLCQRVRQDGIESLDAQDIGLIMEIGQQSGFPFDHPSVLEYCDQLLEITGRFIERHQEQPLAPTKQKSAPSKSSKPEKQQKGCAEEIESSLEKCDSTVDPVTMEEIEPGRAMRLKCGDRYYCFDIDTLKEIVDRDPRNPITREPFSEKLQSAILQAHAHFQKHKTLARFRVATTENKKENLNAILVSEAKREINKILQPLDDTLTYATRLSDQDKRALARRVDDIRRGLHSSLDNYRLYSDEEVSSFVNLALSEAIRNEEELAQLIIQKEFE